MKHNKGLWLIDTWIYDPHVDLPATLVPVPVLVLVLLVPFEATLHSLVLRFGFSQTFYVGLTQHDSEELFTTTFSTKFFIVSKRYLTSYMT